MFAQTVSLSTKYSVNVGEALGLLHALQWLADMQFDNVDFVADSKVIADAFNSHRLDVTEFGHVILACRHLFSSSFTNSRVAFNRRQANVSAHILVGEATLAASPIVYFEVPDCINYVISNEML